MTISTPLASQAFPLWMSLLGLPVDFFQQEHRSFTFSGEDEYDNIKQASALQEALTLNDGEVTAHLMLEGMLQSYIASARIPLKTILESPTDFQEKIRTLRQLQQVLALPELKEKRRSFVESLTRALAHYGVDQRKDVQKMLANPQLLATLRADAFRATEQLRQSQFLQGDIGSLQRPQYNTVIRRWWSVDHMLAAHASIPDGISLNLIATPSQSDTFFCYVVRRGGNLYLLDDAHDFAHPLESSMSRRGQRRLEERAVNFWFPYGWADARLDEEVAGPKREPSTALELLEKTHEFSQVIGSLSELSPEEMAWNSMVLELLVNRFWSPSQPLPRLPLSMTATQALDNNRLLESAAQEANLPVVALPLPALDRLSVKDVGAMGQGETAPQSLGETTTTHHVDWIQRRYGEAIAEGVVNPTPETAALLWDGQAGSVATLDSQRFEAYKRKHPFHDRDSKTALAHSLNRTTFGLPETLAADRDFVARHNYARSLNLLAQQEFQRRREEISQWLVRAYKPRREFLLSLTQAAANSGLDITDWPGPASNEGLQFHSGNGRFYHRDGKRALGWIAPMEQVNWLGWSYLNSPSATSSSRKVLCHVTGAVASQMLMIQPTNALELAWLLGKDVQELPDVLQHRGAYSANLGNSILERIDPLLWALKDPWLEFNLGVCLGLSKRGLAQLCKNTSPTEGLDSLQGANQRIFQGELLKPTPEMVRRPRP